jgi:pimeloyl-ACP methyl ester carboxylesterase
MTHSPVRQRFAPICTRYLWRGEVRKAVRCAAMRLSHQRRGSGPPLVLIHGIGSQWQVWEPVIDGLAAERDVIALDLPGFGESLPLDGAAPSVPELARSVARFVAELGVERPHVAGNSLGGAIALELGRTGIARSVCALSPAGFATGWEVSYAVTSLRITRALGRALAPLAGVLARSAGLRRALSAQMFRHPERVPPAAYASGARNFGRSRGFRATLRAVKVWRELDAAPSNVPTTIAWGERDQLLLYRRQSARARAALPGARHVTLTGCGHVPMWDDPDQVLRVLLDASG